MTDTPAAPERIWAVCEEDDVSADILGEVYAQQTNEGFVGQPTEYVRADLSEARVKELEATLQWYADKVNDCNRHGSDGNAARDALAKDTGDRARAALEGE